MRRRTVKLRHVIARGVILITVALAVALQLLNYLAATQATRSFTRELLIPIAERVSDKTKQVLDTAVDAANTVTLALDDVSPPERLKVAEAVGMGLIASHAELTGVGLGLPDGAYQDVERSATGGIETERVGLENGTRTSEVVSYPPRMVRARGAPRIRPTVQRQLSISRYDPRQRPWYQGASASSRIFISDPFLHFDTRRPILTASQSLRGGDGSPAGVVYASVSVDALTRILSGMTVGGRPVRAFLLDEDRDLVTISGAGEVRTASGLLRLPRIEETNLPDLKLLALTPQFQRAVANGEDQDFEYGPASRRLLAVLRTFSYNYRNWIVGAIIPEEAVIGEIRAGFFQSTVVALVTIALFSGLTLLLANAITRPLRRIAIETERIGRLELHDRELPPTIFEEIASINRVYTTLKTGLRGFQKYVPVRLVQTLLAEGVEPRLGGRMEELSLFFSDLQGFTTLAESMEPNELALLLGNYFEVLTEIVVEEGGTVDKFIGDAVMAFWNAPVKVEDHAVHAVRAAVRCRDALAASLPMAAFRTRFGLHTGCVMVGNFGTADRLSYTALGDGVNLAARLEPLNADYGTQIIISGDMRARLDGRFACRRLDRTTVKGKRVAHEIHEVLGEPGRVPAALLLAAQAYEQALELYFARDFLGAAERFDEAARLRPDDLAAPLLRRRARLYACNPPPADWDGVFQRTAK